MNTKEFNIGEEEIIELSDFFKNFADASRLKILGLLSKGEMNVNALSENLNMGQSAVSHQLRTLKASKLLKARPDGKSTFYSLDDEHIGGIIAYALTHIREENK